MAPVPAATASLSAQLAWLAGCQGAASRVCRPITATWLSQG